MGSTCAENESNQADDGEQPTIPAGVLDGISDIQEGDTAGKNEIESILNY